MRETGALETLNPLRSFLLAGAAIGLQGVASFGVAHAAIITPIGTRLAQGIPFGLIAGTGMGWSLYELRRTLQPQATSVVTLTFGLLMWVALLPMTLLSVTLRATGLHGTNDMWEFVGECALAVAAGAPAGALIGRRLQAGLATGLAALAMALAQAGPVPIMNSTGLRLSA